MRTLTSFIVKLESTRKDTVKMGETELYLESRYEEFKHRVTGGEVVSVPAKYDLGVEPGDKLFFHHHVVTQKGQSLNLDLSDDLYVVIYNDESILHNQAIAYKSKETGELKTLGGWMLLEPVEEDKGNTMVGSLEVVSLKAKPTKKAKLVKRGTKSDHLNINPGDTVHFKKGSDYEIDIDGVTYLRIRPDELMYVEEE